MLYMTTAPLAGNRPVTADETTGPRGARRSHEKIEIVIESAAPREPREKSTGGRRNSRKLPRKVLKCHRCRTRDDGARRVVPPYQIHPARYTEWSAFSAGDITADTGPGPAIPALGASSPRRRSGPSPRHSCATASGRLRTRRLRHLNHPLHQAQFAGGPPDTWDRPSRRAGAQRACARCSRVCSPVLGAALARCLRCRPSRH